MTEVISGYDSCFSAGFGVPEPFDYQRRMATVDRSFGFIRRCVARNMVDIASSLERTRLNSGAADATEKWL